jgi:hypothetical protein
VPNTDEEADSVRSHGWDAVETALVDEDPDLTDLSRDPKSAARIHFGEGA